MKIFRAGAIYAMGNIASAAIPFALLPLLTRILTPAEYGQVVAFSLVTTFCTPFAGLAVPAAVSVAWFNRPRQELPAFVGAALAVTAVSTVATATGAAMLLLLWPALAPEFRGLYSALAALTAGANVVMQCRLSLWQSQQRPLSYAVLQFTASALNVGLSLLGVLVLKLGSDGRNGGIVLSACVMALLALGLLVSSRQVAWSLRRDDIKRLVGFGLPLVPHMLGGVLIMTIDRWFVSIQLGGEALGIYGAGAQLGMVMAILSDAFGKAYSPWLYARLASTEVDDKYCVVGSIYVAVPIFLCAAIIVGGALFLTSSALLGSQYHAAAALLPWFMLGGAFTGIYYCSTNLFFYSNKNALLALTTCCAALIGAPLVWALTTMFGIQGAAMGYAAIQGVLALSINVVASRKFDLPWGNAREAVSIWRSKVFAPVLR